LVFLVSFVTVQATERPNILFISVDDFRPELGSYGMKHIQLLNIDRLVNRLHVNMAKFSPPKEKK